MSLIENPHSAGELLEVPDFVKAKVEKYGKEVLEISKELSKNQLTPSLTCGTLSKRDGFKVFF